MHFPRTVGLDDFFLFPIADLRNPNVIRFSTERTIIKAHHNVFSQPLGQDPKVTKRKSLSLENPKIPRKSLDFWKIPRDEAFYFALGFIFSNVPGRRFLPVSSAWSRDVGKAIQAMLSMASSVQSEYIRHSAWTLWMTPERCISFETHCLICTQSRYWYKTNWTVYIKLWM